MDPNQPKIALLKIAVGGVLSELSYTFKLMTQVANDIKTSSKDIVNLVQLTKMFKSLM
jgi:hypothetical protein